LARNRDCLWNISKKRDIYNDVWMWPRIWQGNRDQIRNPDVIHPRQKLKIPQAGPLTNSEKEAARRYYSRKRH
jgi:nucleoid-associated protein YgaU